MKSFGLKYFGLGDKRQGIVHIIGPEQGFTLPGSTVVCGDRSVFSLEVLGPLMILIVYQQCIIVTHLLMAHSVL